LEAASIGAHQEKEIRITRGILPKTFTDYIGYNKKRTTKAKEKSSEADSMLLLGKNKRL
jgi:hypothetical protein